VGRRAGAHELPPGTTLVVDLTCEMWAPRRLSAGGRSYVCLPTLDGTAPDAIDADVVRTLAARIAAEPGPVYVHCAQGRGRSAAVVAAVLIARGDASDVEQAEAILARARPVVSLNAAQRAWLRRVTAESQRQG
jgi:protein-tyrosine phosphatase